MIYIPFLLRSELIQIDPLLDLEWQNKLEQIFDTLDLDLKIEIDKQILRPKQITWHRISNTFESKVDTSLQVLKFKLENRRMREVVSNILESIQLVQNQDNILFYADYIENVLKQIDEINVDDDLKLIEEKQSIRKIFLYHIAKVIRKKQFVVSHNIRQLNADQIKNFIIEVYIKHEILGHWFRPLTSFEVSKEQNFFFKYYITAQQKIRKFAVVKTSQYYFLLAPGKQVEDNIFSIRRFLTEQLIEYKNRTYIFGLVLPLEPSAEVTFIEYFKSLMEKMVTVEYRLHKTVIEMVATMEHNFQHEIMPLFVEPITFTEKNLDLIAEQHLKTIENEIILKILTPLKRALVTDLSIQDEFDYVFHSVRNIFKEMLNCFEVFKQQPLLIFNKKIQEFGYRILSYLKLLERRREELFVSLTHEEYAIINQRAQAPIEDLYHAITSSMDEYLVLQRELKEVERSKVKKVQGGSLFANFFPKQNSVKTYNELFHEAMTLKKKAYHDLLFIPRQYKKYCVMIQDENLMSIQGFETYYAFSHGENGIGLLPIIFHIQNDLTDFSIEKISTTLSQAISGYTPFQINKNDGIFIDT